MTDQFRAMCAELVEELERYQRDYPAQTDKEAYRAMSADAVLDCARTLLTESEVPTDEELLKLIPQALDDSLSGASRAMFENSLSSASDVYKALIKQELRFARAILARWGRQ